MFTYLQIVELEHFHKKRMQQFHFGERRSDSLYFTPSGTPLREIPDLTSVSGLGGTGSEPSSTVKNMSFSSYSNDMNAYKAVYAGHHAGHPHMPYKKTHRRVRSLGQYLPTWFPGGGSGVPLGGGTGCGNELGNKEVVQVIVEAQPNQDYFDVPPNEEDRLLSVVDTESGEATVVLTPSSSEVSESTSKTSFSNQSSSVKKPASSMATSVTSSSCISKKTEMTQLSGVKSQLDLCAHLLTDCPPENYDGLKPKKKRLSL